MVNLVECEELISGSELTSDEGLSFRLTVSKIDEMPSHYGSRMLNVLDQVSVTVTIHGGIIICVEVQEIILVSKD